MYKCSPIHLGECGCLPLQGLPDSLHRLEAAERRRRLLRVGRRLEQAVQGRTLNPKPSSSTPASAAAGPGAPAPPYLPGTSFRVDMLQQRADRVGR